MPRRLCSHPTCPDTATYRGYCPAHAKQRERNRNQSRADKRRVYNSKRWAQTRKAVLFDQPLCKCGEIAVDVDHITPLEQGGHPFDRSNLQALCPSCHSQKTNQEMRSSSSSTSSSSKT